MTRDGAVGRPLQSVAVVTGTRAEFYLLSPLIEALSRARGPRPTVIAGGMHLSRSFGRTIDEVRRRCREWGVPVSRPVPMLPRTDLPLDMARALAQGLRGMADVFARLRPDAVVVLGDRAEAFAGALAGMYAGALVVHLHGGETTMAGPDDPLRDATTRVAHLHLAATRAAGSRLRTLGEPSWRIRVIGAFGAEQARLSTGEPDGIRREIGLPAGAPYRVVLHHAVPGRKRAALREMEEIASALRAVRRTEPSARVVAIHPNADAGGRALVAVLRRLRKRDGWIVRPNLSQRRFHDLLRHAEAFVGNSSSGLLETPVLRVPMILVGDRQGARERGGNVVPVRADRREILRALRLVRRGGAWRKGSGRWRHPFGGFGASARAVRILSRLRVTERWLQKGTREPGPGTPGSRPGTL